MYSYIAYGISVSCEFPLPELLPTETQSQITIRKDRVHFPGSPPTREGALIARSRNELYLSRQRVATLAILGGHTILVDAAAGSDPDEVRHYLLGQGVAALLHQRGLLVLHASCIRIGESAVAVSGHAGWGKSTLLAAFYARGFPVVSDDVTCLSPDGRVFPGFPRIKLWSDAAEALGFSADALHPVFPGWEKQAVRADRGFSTKSLALKRIFVLGEANGRLDLHTSLRSVLDHLYCKPLVDEQDFVRSSALVNRVPIYSLQRVSSFVDLDGAVHRILKESSHAD